jgi:hypothetical protein
MIEQAFAENVMPVRIAGGSFTPTTYSLWAIFAACVYLIIKMRPAMKKLQMEQDGSLRTDLLKRVGDLEMELAAERRDCERRLSKMQLKLDGAIRQMVSFQLMTAQLLPSGAVPPATLSMMKNLTEDLLGSLTVDANDVEDPEMRRMTDEMKDQE